MRAQIYKLGAWRDMSYSPGQSPIVTNQIEGDVTLFEFQAPKATLIIDADVETRFAPEGAWEITRGDIVRIYADSVRVFQGIVDREITYDKTSGTISFRASGWIAEINQLVAGRLISGAHGEDLYRYAKTEKLLDDPETRDVDESDIEYEYIATPGIYEDDWDDDLPKRTGYRKVSLFDTRSVLPAGVFQSENNQATGFNTVSRGGQFSNAVYRRLMRDGDKTGTLFSITLTNVILQLVVQINIAKSGYSLGTISPGVISNEFPVAIPLDVRLFRYVHFVSFNIGDTTELFPILWSYENDEPRSIKVVYLTRLVSQFDIEDIERIEFTGDVYAYDDNNEERLGVFYITRVFNLEDRIIIFQMWSTRGQSGNVYDLRVKAQWYVYNPETGELSERFENSDLFERNLIFGEYTANELYKSAGFPRQYWGQNNDGEDVLLNHAHGYFPVVCFSTDHFAQDQYLTYQDENGVYSLRNQKIVFTGTISINKVAFEFKNIKLTKVIVEICKLTNSVFYIDKDKRINIVSRSYYNDIAVHNITQVENIRQVINDNYGNEAPIIRSDIVENEAFNNMLEAYYVDTYFAAKEDQWELVLPRNATNSAIELLDPVTFGDITSEVETPAIVRRVEIREDNVILTVTRARAA